MNGANSGRKPSKSNEVETVEVEDDESEHEDESEVEEDEVIVIEKKTKKVTKKRKKCASQYIEQVTNEELLERAEMSEDNEADIALERDIAMDSLISLR